MDVENVETVVDIRNAYFSYKKVEVLTNISMQLPKGCRCLLLGDNGAGKTTLLKILAGKLSVAKGEVTVLGRDANFDPHLNVKRSYLGGDWGRTVIPFAGVTILQADIRVGDMMKKLQERFKERRQVLYKLLQINENWRMHLVSDGQRRRVQIMLSLLRPFEILFLDEITTDLDVVTRHDLMQYLISECETRGVSIVYTTHIFDGLDGWATHLAYLSAGVLTTFAPVADIPELSSQTSGSSTLMKCISTWIRRDRQSNLSKQTESYDQLSSTKINPDGSAGGYTAGRMKLKGIDFQ